jgi:hypothetical protein
VGGAKARSTTSARVLGTAHKLYRRRHHDHGCRIASSSRAITATAGIPNVSPGASLPIGMPPAVVFDLVGQSAAAATAALRALLAPFNWPLLRMTAPISRAASLRRYSRRAILRPLPPLDGIGEGLDNGFDPVEG